jgi:HTH-type transcriptional regulator / antitoxin PezA
MNVFLGISHFKQTVRSLSGGGSILRVVFISIKQLKIQQEMRLIYKMNNKVVGQLIRNLRQEKNLKMESFCEIIGISQPTLSRIETGKQDITIETLTKILSYFDVSFSEFFMKVEGMQNLTDVSLDFERNDINVELTKKIHNEINKLSIEQKKALYVILLSMH